VKDQFKDKRLINVQELVQYLGMSHYLHAYPTVSEACHDLARYFLFYNMEQLHESPWYHTPNEIYVKERGNRNPMQASTIHLI